MATQGARERAAHSGGGAGAGAERARRPSAGRGSGGLGSGGSGRSCRCRRCCGCGGRGAGPARPRHSHWQRCRSRRGFRTGAARDRVAGAGRGETRARSRCGARGRGRRPAHSGPASRGAGAACPFDAVSAGCPQQARGSLRRSVGRNFQRAGPTFVLIHGAGDIGTRSCSAAATAGAGAGAGRPRFTKRRAASAGDRRVRCRSWTGGTWPTTPRRCGARPRERVSDGRMEPVRGAESRRRSGRGSGAGAGGWNGRSRREEPGCGARGRGGGTSVTGAREPGRAELRSPARELVRGGRCRCGLRCRSQGAGRHGGLHAGSRPRSRRPWGAGAPGRSRCAFRRRRIVRARGHSSRRTPGRGIQRRITGEHQIRSSIAVAPPGGGMRLAMSLR
jgi:hypothetical protein